MMRAQTLEELKEILDLHAKWLRGDPEGRRADLRNANLIDANLINANLRYANLRNANLGYTDLSSADLRNADLRNANLSSAKLRNANLGYTDLRSANLRSANLRSADLSGADLRSANLYGAILRSAILRSAILRSATINWHSHELISEIILRFAGDSVSRRSLAGLIRVSEDWCWDVWETLDHPDRAWALGCLSEWVQDGDGAPVILRQHSER